MKAKIYFLFVVSLVILSCSDSEVVDPKLDYSDAIQLQKNNYWVYQSKALDITSGLSVNELDDSTYISKDTIIDNKVFYIIENPFGLKDIKTKVAGNIINVENRIEFSATNFTDTLYKDSELLIYGLMQKEETRISVPAGTFNTVAFIVLQKNTPGHYHNNDPNNPSIYDKDYSIMRKIWYAKNVGVVKSVIYYGNFVGFERNLMRYRVNN